jgi:enolase
VEFLCDEKRVLLDVEWDLSVIDKLNSHLKKFKIESFEDFSRLKDKLNWMNDNDYKILESTLFNSLFKPWRYFSPDIKQVPRPMSLVFSHDKKIKEFFVFSLNAGSFDGALEANMHVIDYVKKSIKDDIKDENILMLIKEAIDEEHSIIDFELRIGIVFNNSLNTNERQFEDVSKLIDNYDLCYIENPFGETNFNDYKKLNDKYKSKCLISINSISNGDKLIDKKMVNSSVVKFKNIKNFISEVNNLKDNKINVVAEAEPLFVDAFIGLGVPLIKLSDDKIGNQISKRIITIIDEVHSQS